MSNAGWQPPPAGGPPPPGFWQASDGQWYPPHLHPSNQGVSPYGAPPSYGPPSTNGFAIAALVLGIIWMWGIGSILALVFGYKARREIDQSHGRQGGRGMAIAGIVLGWIGVAGTVLLVAGLIALSSTDTYDDYNSDPADGFCNGDRIWEDPRLLSDLVVGRPVPSKI